MIAYGVTIESHPIDLLAGDDEIRWQLGKNRAWSAGKLTSLLIKGIPS
jgi:hypothetical protein